MAEAIQRTDEDSSLFNTFPSSGPPRRFNPSEDEDAPYFSGGDNRSWNFGAEEDAEMRRLRSESAAQKQKAAAEEKRAAQEPKVAKGKRKARVVSEEEEEERSEDMSMSEGEDADAEVEEDVDVEGEVCVQGIYAPYLLNIAYTALRRSAEWFSNLYADSDTPV